jgi:hypothetical protein
MVVSPMCQPGDEVDAVLRMQNQVNVRDRKEAAYSDHPTDIQDRYDVRRTGTFKAEAALISRNKVTEKLISTIGEREVHRIS